MLWASGLPVATRRSPSTPFKAASTANGGRYGVITLHRPSNVDDPAMMARIGGALKDIAVDLPLIFPVHPRARAA